MFNAITGSFFTDEGAIILDGEDITFKKEHFRSKDIGHLFQDPLLGTAPHMTIEENMALAYLRASTAKTAFFSRISTGRDRRLRITRLVTIRHMIGGITTPYMIVYGSTCTAISGRE